MTTKQQEEQEPPPHHAVPPADSPDPAPMTKAPEPGSMALVAQPGGAVVPSEAGTAALTAQIEGQLKARFFLARQYPRDWRAVRTQLLAAMKRPVLAEGALYKKPIGGGHAEGLSIRFAEEGFRTMGNATVDTMLVSDDPEKRVYIVTGTDLETLASIPVTVVVTKEIERSSVKKDSIVLRTRTNSQGKPTYVLRAVSEDDYRSKEQALLQKARRDVILFLMPGDIKEECEAQIRKTVDDRDREDPEAARNRVADLYFGLGVTIAELEKFLGHGLRTMNSAELHVLRKIYTAIKEGEGTWAEALSEKLGTNTGADEVVKGDPAPAAAAKGAGAKLAETLAKKE